MKHLNFASFESHAWQLMISESIRPLISSKFPGACTVTLVYFFVANFDFHSVRPGLTSPCKTRTISAVPGFPVTFFNLLSAGLRAVFVFVAVELLSRRASTTNAAPVTCAQ